MLQLHFEKIGCKLGATPFRGNNRAAANSGVKKLAVQWLIEHSTSHQLLW
jgi:hypothetical protein